MRIAATVMATLMMTVLAGCGASVAEEKAAIAATLQAKYGGSNATVAVETIVVRQKFAVADWVAGDIGGRSVMRKAGEWQVLVTTGQEARDPAFLQKAGMPADVARALANMLVTNERQIPEDKLAKLDRFAAAP
jgi:hypothetical protein